MKIAYILPKLANQGPIIVAKDIIDNIKDRIELIDVYYFDDVVEIDFECNIYKISFFDKIDFEKYDIVHSHMLRPDLYVWYHRKKSHIKTLFVSTLHQNIYENLKGNYNSIVAVLFEIAWLFILKKQDIVVALTNEMKEFYLKKTKLNLSTIYNGRSINLNGYNQSIKPEETFFLDVKKKYKVIGAHCLLTKRKGISQVVKSLQYLKDYCLVIIGDGKEMEALIKLSADLNLIDRCFFLGYKTNAVEYLKYFDIYVMASYSEGFPLGLLEAGLNKLPVVCSNIPIFRELFSVKEVCFFELDNTDSLSEAIKLCYKDKEGFSSSIFHLIDEKYSVNRMSDNYLKLYLKKL
jgi:glycosyltransferase involved in cell wall biosynthesis